MKATFVANMKQCLALALGLALFGGPAAYASGPIDCTSTKSTISGVTGRNSAGGVGVYGLGTSGPGMIGQSTSGHGMVGASSSGNGVEGWSISGNGGYFSTNSGYAGVIGHNDGGLGMIGTSK